MVFIITLVTVAIIVVWYLVRGKFKKNVFGYEKSNYKINANVTVLTVFILITMFTIALYYIYSINNQHKFLVESGILFAFVLAILGLILKLINKIVGSAINRKYKKQFNEEETVLDLNVPISIYFDMAIIALGALAYTIGEISLLAICVSIITGEYIGLLTFIEKKHKEDSLWAKLKSVPLPSYIFFLVLIISIILKIKLSYIIAHFIGYVLGVIVILCIEAKKYRNGKQSEFYEKYGNKSACNPTKPEDVMLPQEFTDASNNRNIQIIRSENDIRILKNDDTFNPVKSVPEIIEYINSRGTFTESSNWFLPNSSKFSKKFEMAKKAYANNATVEDVVLLKDNTVNGTAKSGLVLTTTALYQSAAFERDFICNTEHIKRLFVEKTPYSPGLYSIYIYVDGVDREILTAFKSDINNLFISLYDVIAYMYGYEE